jgi:hypothetical protein
MKRKLLFGILILAFLVTGCAWFQTIQARTETMVISYETIGTIAFPTVLAYLQEREKNGSLAGDSLLKAKATYKTAKQKYLDAGDIMINIVNGTVKPVGISNIALLLREAAIMLADLSAKDGGKVDGNMLTVPKTGGVK